MRNAVAVNERLKKKLDNYIITGKSGVVIDSQLLVSVIPTKNEKPQDTFRNFFGSSRFILKHNSTCTATFLAIDNEYGANLLWRDRILTVLVFFSSTKSLLGGEILSNNVPHGAEKAFNVVSTVCPRMLWFSP